MKKIALALSSMLLAAWPTHASRTSVLGEDVNIIASDGIEISAYWQSVESAKATITLFHMGGGSAHGEYPNIAPKLNSYGFNTLAVDLRSGGDRLGAPNKTAARLGEDVSYCDAYPDLVGSLNWVTANTTDVPVIAWGSSFSAALTIQLAAKQGNEIAGALAFSPASGGPMEDCKPDLFIGDVSIPMMMLRPDNEMEVPSVIAQAKAFRNLGYPYLEVAGGRHGSLMLDETRTEKDMHGAWGRVLSFLNYLAIHKIEAYPSQALDIQSEGWELKADFVSPNIRKDEIAPAVLLLSQANGLRHDYALLAQSLADRGVASLRVDLRAHGDSTNLGRFEPPFSEHLQLLEGTERDIVAALNTLKMQIVVDKQRIAVLGASYSGEYMALAGREVGYEHAYVALAPGSFSDESISQIDASGADWLFVRAEQEFDFFDEIFDEIRNQSKKAVIRVVPGSGHATNLLSLKRDLLNEIAEWLAEVLRGPSTS